jgi:hypothetical protein
MAVTGTHSPRPLRRLGSNQLVALRVVQEADLQRGTSRCEEDGAAADDEVGGWELLGGEPGQRHFLFLRRGLVWYVMKNLRGVSDNRV